MSSSVEPALVPELLVADVVRSVEFWCGLCGFVVEYQRDEEGFAYVVRGSAHVMLEQQGIGRNWITGPLERPLGRGINFQINVPDLAPILSALAAADYPLSDLTRPPVDRRHVDRRNPTAAVGAVNTRGCPWTGYSLSKGPIGCPRATRVVRRLHVHSQLLQGD